MSYPFLSVSVPALCCLLLLLPHLVTLVFSFFLTGRNGGEHRILVHCSQEREKTHNRSGTRLLIRLSSLEREIREEKQEERNGHTIPYRNMCQQRTTQRCMSQQIEGRERVCASSSETLFAATEDQTEHRRQRREREERKTCVLSSRAASQILRDLIVYYQKKKDLSVGS